MNVINQKAKSDRRNFYNVDTNFNGINLSNSGAEFLDKLNFLKELGISIAQGAEGNNNWSQGDTYNRAKKIIRQVNGLVTSFCKEEITWEDSHG
eukprot:10138731-Ditylum_brightwellii.AAC.1